MRSIRQKTSFFLILCSLALFSNCKKENLDYKVDYREFTEAIEPSLVRLVNIGGNRNLEVDGDSLTNFRWPPASPEAPDEARAQVLPTKYFPSTGQLGLTWSVPNEFFTPEHAAEMTFYSGPTLNRMNHTFSVHEDGNKPTDYYLLKIEREMHEGPKVIEVPRDVTAPSRPDHFKIRLLNFAQTFDNYLVTAENLMTPMTLAYADGTPVSPETTNVPIGQWSEYVEVPYGTYQFKVLTQDKRQVPMATTSPTIHVGTSAIPDKTQRDPNDARSPASTGLVYAELQTFQPGGIYSIAVHPYTMKYDAPGAGNAFTVTDIIQNAFQIITDLSAPLNNTYARVQLVNATLNSAPLQLELGQERSTEAVPSEHYSDYLTSLVGSRVLQVKDPSGNIVIHQEVQLQAGKNYSLWVYTDGNQELQSLLVSNNLAASEMLGNSNSNGNYGDPFRRHYTFPFAYRFLNLLTGFKEITLTDHLGTPYGAPASHLLPGVAKADNPYYFNIGTDQYKERWFMLYQSSPTELPGRWISEVTGLSTKAMVADETLYTQANRNIPNVEPGVYTVAAIGTFNDGQKNAKIMYVKHTK
ncbi:hypothetical protein ACFOET_02440 [Parapedobacter deserti]|uniref:DUF4397 domain-containing protein n=1 Tax=Parapedobacter deserti TaxID=1912957 RepID=A0ABV7JHY0_9SPHI